MAEILLSETANSRAIHLYDNGQLTFIKLKEIFSAASDGSLEGTEKTGSISLLISFSAKDGRLKCAKTKADIKNGGISIEQFANSLETDKKDIFLNSAKLLEKTIQSLSHDKQSNIFGGEANIFFSCSLLGSTDEIINYDTKSLIINLNDHIIYDRESNSFADKNIDSEVSALKSIIDDSQEQLKQDNYSVQINAVKRLKALADKQPLNTAISKINSLLSAANTLIKNDSLRLSEESSISEFMVARVYVLINAILQRGKIKDFDPVLKMNIAKRILGVKGISVNDITSKISKEQLEFVKENLLNEVSRNEILKTAILPLETIVNDFAVDILRGLQSAFILDNNKEVNRIKNELKRAIDILQSSENEEVLKTLRQQMTKLRPLEKLETAVDGFVFGYDGTVYKFSGNFSPISKILNIFKNIKKSNPSQLKEATGVKREVIALVPGAFKPPHKGHLDMVKQYANIADKVIILISPLPRQTPAGKNVTADISKKIWNIYLKSAGLESKVLLMDSQWNSPVHAVHKFLENEDNRQDFAQPGQTIVLGVSTKGEDAIRFKQDYLSRYAGKGLTIKIVPASQLDNISSTDMRVAIDNKDQKSLKNFLPSGLDKKKTSLEIMSYFYPPDSSLQENYIYDIIKEELLKKGDKYYLVSLKGNKK